VHYVPFAFAMERRQLATARSNLTEVVRARGRAAVGVRVRVRVRVRPPARYREVQPHRGGRWA